MNFAALLSNPTTYIGLSAFGYLLYTRFRRRDIESAFIYSMATNHLPHIYHVLLQVTDKLDIPRTEPPQIKFISAKDFNEKEG